MNRREALNMAVFWVLAPSIFLKYTDISETLAASISRTITQKSKRKPVLLSQMYIVRFKFCNLIIDISWLEDWIFY